MIKQMNNLESVGQMIGSLMGMSEAMDEAEYTQALIAEAHGHASNLFDIAAASLAQTGKIAHVYEYGTAGITPGKVVHPNPLTPDARLYEHVLEGEQGNVDIRYTFRPAVTPNPKHTTKSTGVPSKYLSKLSNRRYIFHSRAFVMETGMSVSIRGEGKNGLVFVPFGANSENPRGYVMYPTASRGPIVATPGAEVAGNFSHFWVGWWATEGQQFFDEHMRKKVNEDIQEAVLVAARKAKAEQMKPAAAVNVPAATSQGVKSVKSLVKRKNTSRRARRRKGK